MRIVKEFLYALIFLTKIPVPFLTKASEKNWGRITPYFVLIGFIVGLILFYLSKLFVELKLPVLFSALLVLLVWILITGALHLDGLMDTFDGICCQDEARKLEAMKDSRIGAFGAMGGIFVVLFKLISLSTILLNTLYFLILFSVPLARLASVYSLSFFKSNSGNGISSSLLTRGIKKPMDFLINFSLFFIVLFFYFHGRLSMILFFGICFFVSVLIAYWLSRHFKGHSGDTYGALIELSEVVVLSLGVVLKNYF